MALGGKPDTLIPESKVVGEMTMKPAVLVLICFGVSLTMAAQTAVQPQAAGPNTATAPVVVRWAEGAPGASSTVQNGVTIESLRSGDVLVKLGPLSDLGPRITQSWVGIQNSGPEAVELHADKASVEVVKPTEKTLPAVPADNLAKAISSGGAALAQVLNSTNRQGNLNCTAAQRAAGCQPPGSESSTQAAHDQQAMATQQSQWVREHGLRAASLQPGSSLQGALFFPRDKAKGYIVRIPVGNYVFEFPFGQDAGGKHN